MTIITKPITEKKLDKTEEPLVQNAANEALPTKIDLESADSHEPTHYYVLRTRARRVSTATTVCLFITALLVMSIGIIGGVYLYRQFARTQVHRFRGWCSIPYDHNINNEALIGEAIRNHAQKMKQRGSLLADSDLFKSLSQKNEREPGHHHQFFKEDFEIDIEYENYETIDVPDFSGGRRGRFIHDFNTNKTGIIDLDGQRCFVMPLNRQYVLPPRSLADLVKKMWSGYYEVDTRVVRETMRVIVPAVKDFKFLGYYIAHQCQGVPTYMLEKVVSNVHKRSTDVSPVEFREFAGSNIVEFHIVNLNELEKSNEEKA